MSSTRIDGVSMCLSIDHIKGVTPFLKWVKDKAPQKQYRMAARTALMKLELRPHDKEVGFKQVILTRKEEKVMQAVHEAFPYELVTPKQLKLL
jgi:hypothetical protein